MSDDPDDRPAGLPSERSNKIVYVVAMSVLSLPFIALAYLGVRQCATTTFADTLGEIEVKGLDAPGEKPLPLAAGTPLVFALSTSYSYSGNPTVWLDVSLRRDGAEVAKQECNMKGFTGIGSSGSGFTTWYGDAGWTCALDVPQGGATSVKVVVTKGGKGALELSNTSVFVKRP